MIRSLRPTLYEHRKKEKKEVQTSGIEVQTLTHPHPQVPITMMINSVITNLTGSSITKETSS